MTKLYKLAMGFGALMGMLFSFQARATHLMGADMTWKCLGGDTFEIVATVYRDCKGIALSNSPFSFYGECPGFETPQSLSGTMEGGQDITPTCKQACTQCSQAGCPDNPFGFQQWTITAKVVFPKGCCKWKVSWTQNARNNAITTLDNPGARSLYTEVEINTCIKNPCDNSPYFTIPPVGIFCINQCIVFNPGANDDDRDVNGQADSLAYSFGDPLDAENSKIPYISGYSSKEPLKYTGTDPDATFTYPTCAGFHLDPETGDISFRATKLDNTVMVILVDEYRKDSLGVYQKIGTTRRDIEISIVDCSNNHAPMLTGINGGTGTSIKVCTNVQTCFTIKAFDIDPKDSVKMSWNSQIPGASFTVKHDGKKWPTAVFCWRPTDKDVRSYPYQFIVTAVDDHCLVPGRASKAFSIYVVPSPKADYFTRIEACGKVYFQADPSALTKVSISDYLWHGDGSPGYGPLYIHARTGYHQYERPGTYHYTLSVSSANGCVFTYSDSVKIAPYVQISIPNDTLLCQNSPPITIKATHRLGNAPYTIWWNTGDKTDHITEWILKDTVFVAYIKDGNGCTNYDSMRVKLQKLPVPRIGPPQRGCWGHPLLLSTKLNHMSYVSWTQIKGGDTTKDFLQGDSIYVNDSGKYVVSVRDSIGCPGYDTTEIYYNPLVKVTPLDTDACVGDSVRMSAGIAGPDAAFTWIDEIHNQVVSTARTYTFKALNTKNGHRFMVVINQTRNGVTCVDSGEKIIRVHNLPTPLLKDPGDHCITDLPFSLNNYVDKAHLGGTWYYSKNSSAVYNNYLYPAILGPGADYYIHYLYADQFRCGSDDSVKVTITDKPILNAGPDTVICTANGRYNLTAQVSPDRRGGTWYVLNQTPKSALYKSPNGDSVYFDPLKVSYDSVYGVVYSWTNLSSASKCGNTDTVYLTVRTNPSISITHVEDLCENDLSVQLNAQPGGGTWHFNDNTDPKSLVFDPGSNTWSFDPAIAGAGKHHLVYTAWGDLWRKMCASVDSITINVVGKPSPLSFTTEDKQWEYCVNHGIVKLIPNLPWPGGAFSGRGVFMIGSQGYFDPSKADSTDINQNVISYTVPYNEGKCFFTITHKIAVDPRPWVQIQTSPSLCEGTIAFDITAEADNTTGTDWVSDNDNRNFLKKSQTGNLITMQFYPSQSQLKAGSFHIYVKGWNNGKCDTARDSKLFIIYPKPVPDYTSEQQACEPFTVHFKSITSQSQGRIKTYDWDFGDGSQHSSEKDPVHIFTVMNGQPSQKFSPKLTVSNENGCTADTLKKDWITVNASPVPFIFAKPQFTTIAMPKIQFSIGDRSRNIDFNDPNTTFSWSFGDWNSKNGDIGHSNLRNPEYTYSDTGKYTIVLRVNSKGCTGQDSEVNYIDIRPELVIFIPNVFKPDSMHSYTHGENYYSAWENETFQPVVNGAATFEMKIFNRWGELMYTTESPEHGWDGRYKGNKAMEGVYAYVIKATSFSGKPYTFTGTVTLLR